jgi:hypothetical protein
MSRTLHLPLKKEWYEMIESGVKTEEYRGITAYWIPRLLEYADGSNIPRITANVLVGHPEILSLRLGQGVIVFKRYTHIKFSYGYTKRTMTFECNGITIGKGRNVWGAPDNDVFIIKLGRRIS